MLAEWATVGTMVAIAGAGGLCRLSYLLGRRIKGKDGNSPRAPLAIINPALAEVKFVHQEVCEERHKNIQTSLAEIKESVKCLPAIKVVVDQLWRNHDEPR